MRISLRVNKFFEGALVEGVVVLLCNFLGITQLQPEPIDHLCLMGILQFKYIRAMVQKNMQNICISAQWNM